MLTEAELKRRLTDLESETIERTRAGSKRIGGWFVRT